MRIVLAALIGLVAGGTAQAGWECEASGNGFDVECYWAAEPDFEEGFADDDIYASDETEMEREEYYEYIEPEHVEQMEDCDGDSDCEEREEDTLEWAENNVAKRE